MRDQPELSAALAEVDRPLWFRPAPDGWVACAATDPAARAFVPPIAPSDLGSASFRARYGLRLAYVGGAMANGIASVELVVALARAGALGIFGAAGLAPAAIDDALARLHAELGPTGWGCNLIHTPEPTLEARTVDVLLARDVRLVEASAYMQPTPALVRYRARGLHERQGRIVAPRRVIAKVSRFEVARWFWSPPPARILDELVAAGDLTSTEAALASQLPIAEDLTVEADSGGHTDNRPLITALPTIQALARRMQGEWGDRASLEVGAAGGIGTPQAAAAAFAMGAGWIVLGSVHQACVESGSSDAVRAMLAAAEQADVAMAPAADMFELGVELQVLKRGTMFPMRARWLRELYMRYEALEAIPPAELERLERQLLRAPVAEIWAQTERFWLARDPSQVERARAEPKHRMALVFRWYLGLASRWANEGREDRRLDYQVWCGPAMGAFNAWTAGTDLSDWRARHVGEVARRIMRGAAVELRTCLARAQGVIPPSAGTGAGLRA